MSALPPFSKEFLAKYTGLAPLGEGGMALVFRARDERLDRAVAIKVLKQVEPDQAARFRREARALAALEHPHILRVFDAGCDGALPYLVCELVDGHPLDAQVWDHPVDVDESVRATLEVGAALAFAHGRGIVHRDVKPENVLVTRAGVHKLADFGLARPITSGHTVTAADVVMGTPEFLAPELVEGAVVSPVIDQYALGVTLYWLVTRRYPFEGESAAQQLLARLSTSPAPPSRHAPVPPELERVILRMLARDAGARYESVDAACAALGAATGARPPRPRGRAAGASRPVPARAVARVTTAVPASWKRAALAAALAGFVAVGLGIRLRPGPPADAPASSSASNASRPLAVQAPPPGRGPITAVLRWPRFRGHSLGLADVREVRTLTGMDLGVDPAIYRYWIDLADWLEGRRAVPPRFARAEPGEIDILQEPLFIRSLHIATGRDVIAVASVAIRFTASTPEDPRPWLVLGRTLFVEDQRAEARRAFAHALKLDFCCGNMDWPPVLAAGYVHALVEAGPSAEDRIVARATECGKFARGAWVGVLDALGGSDLARCEALLRRGARTPGQEAAAVHLAQFLLVLRGSYAAAKAMLEERLAARPGELDTRQKLLDFAWERGDEADANRLLPPLLDRDLQHRNLPALLFPDRLTAPPRIDPEHRDDETYVRNAYLVRLLEAGQADEAERAFLDVHDRFTAARETAYRLDVQLHQRGQCPAVRLDTLRAALARGSGLVWSELAGAVAREPGSPAERLLDEAAGAAPPQPALAALARALAASRRGAHDRAVAGLGALAERHELAGLPPELALEVVARAVYASAGQAESAASQAARALHVAADAGGAMPGHDLRPLAAALSGRDLEAAARAAERLFLDDPEPELAGWVLLDDARLRRHDAAATRLWARRLAASARALGSRIWALPELARLAGQLPR